jgi:hypothetical protein
MQVNKGRLKILDDQLPRKFSHEPRQSDDLDQSARNIFLFWFIDRSASKPFLFVLTTYRNIEL